MRIMRELDRVAELKLKYKCVNQHCMQLTEIGMEFQTIKCL